MKHQQSDKVRQVIVNCVIKAEQAFKRTFPVPSCHFNVRGKAAGKAYLQRNEIRLNPILFDENPTAFFKEVIPHEVAHLITYQIYGRVQPHGKEWQSIMENVFQVPAKTTHSFDVASVQGKTFEYRCHCTTYPLSIRRHNKVQRNQATYSCQKCRCLLAFTGVQLS